MSSTCDICEFELDDAEAHFPHVELCPGEGCTCGVRVHPACCWRCKAGVGDHGPTAADDTQEQHMDTIEILDFVGTADIADRVNVSRSSPGLWETRREDFPRRVATINAVNGAKGFGVWHWKEVEAWCRKTGRLPLEEGRIYDDNGFDMTDKVRRGRKARM